MLRSSPSASGRPHLTTVSGRPPTGPVRLAGFTAVTDRGSSCLARGSCAIVAGPPIRRAVGPVFETGLPLPQLKSNKGVRETQELLVPSVVPSPAEFPDSACRCHRSPLHSDPDLARIVSAWGSLPENIKRAILALVGAVAE